MFDVFWWATDTRVISEKQDAFVSQLRNRYRVTSEGNFRVTFLWAFPFWQSNNGKAINSGLADQTTLDHLPNMSFTNQTRGVNNQQDTSNNVYSTNQEMWFSRTAAQWRRTAISIILIHLDCVDDSRRHMKFTGAIGINQSPPHTNMGFLDVT